MQTMHLFAGAGGGLLADRILGHYPIIAVEWDAYCCQVLRERAADGWFPNLSVWEGDVRLFDPSEYAGRVDCIHAGFPCQDISVAGNQAGVGPETRSGLYREVLRIAGVVRPRYLFLENVSAIVSNGLGTVLADLAALGFDAEWLCLRASDCGAQHHRDRWWLLAYSVNDRSQNRRDSAIKPKKEIHTIKCLCTNFSDTNNKGLEGSLFGKVSGKEIQMASSRCCEDVADSIGIGQPGQGESIERSHKTPHGEGEADHVESVCFRGFWGIEPYVGRVANGVAARVDRLKALGNGQVPLQAALAWKLLGGP